MDIQKALEQPKADVRFFQITSPEIQAAVDRFEEAFYRAMDLREELWAKYGAVGVVGSPEGLVALRFAADAPEGWKPHVNRPGYFVPDFSTLAGQKAASDFYNPELAIPSEHEVNKLMGLPDSMMTPEGLVRPRLHVHDGEAVMVVPAVLAGKITCIPGTQEISSDEFWRARDEAYERPEQGPELEQRRRARP